MSVVVTYVRLSHEQLERAALHPDVIHRLGGEEDHPAYGGAETLYFDKAYEPIAWLLSPLARAQADHTDRLFRNPDEPDEAARSRVAAMKAMPIDPAWEALHGDRGHVDPRFDIGLDPPAVMSPDKVRALSEVLDKISRADLERHFDLAEMDRLDLCYLDEEDVMDEYVLPEFERLQAFYRAAAANNQVVMVLFT